MPKRGMLSLPGTATREQRLARARSVAENALDRYAENVIAIGIYGSTARGDDEPYSDLELAVVLRQPVDVERYEYYLDGWKTDVELLQSDTLFRDVRSIDITWPIWGGQFQHVVSLYDRHSFWSRLRRHIAETPDALFQKALHESLVWEFLEHIGKYRNARLRGDGKFMRWAAWQLAWDAVRLVGLLNRTYYTSRPRAFAESLALPLVPEGYAELIERFESGRLADLKQLDACCERMVAGLLSLVQSQGIAIEVRERPI